MKHVAVAAVLFGTFAAAVILRAQTSQAPTISVVRDTGCGCCLNWVAHLQRAGFKATVTESPNRAADNLRACVIAPSRTSSV